MEKKRISLDELRDALMDTFKSYGWATTDYDVWVGIHSYFAERLWRALDKEELKEEGKLRQYPEKPAKYKHIFGRFYLKEI